MYKHELCVEEKHTTGYKITTDNEQLGIAAGVHNTDRSETE